MRQMHSLFCSYDQVGGAVCLEVRVTLFQEEDKLFGHATDVVTIDKGKAELHGTPVDSHQYLLKDLHPNANI